MTLTWVRFDKYSSSNITYKTMEKTKYKDIFHKRHDLPDNAKVVMFAPTFREGAKNGIIKHF